MLWFHKFCFASGKSHDGTAITTVWNFLIKKKMRITISTLVGQKRPDLDSNGHNSVHCLKFSKEVLDCSYSYVVIYCSFSISVAEKLRLKNHCDVGMGIN